MDQTATPNVFLPSLFASVLLLFGCGEPDPETECIDAMLNSEFPLTVENIDTTGMGNDFQPQMTHPIGRDSDELEDLTFGWRSPINSEVLVELRPSEGAEMDETKILTRQVYWRSACDADLNGGGVLGAGKVFNVSAGDLIVVTVQGCPGDCDLSFTYPPETNDGG